MVTVPLMSTMPTPSNSVVENVMRASRKQFGVDLLGLQQVLRLSVLGAPNSVVRGKRARGSRQCQNAGAWESAIPSRMSCSDTVISLIGARAATRVSIVDRINAPPPITSTRPGCM